MGRGIQKRKSFIIVIFLLWVAGAFILVWGRYGRNEAKTAAAYRNVTVAEFDEALTRNPFVVDVHVPEQTHVTGTDAFIPYQEVGARLAEFPQDKSAEVIVYCRSGSMSAAAARVLADAGYTNVKNLVGGVQAWREVHQGVELTPETIDLGTVVYGEIKTTEFTLTNNTEGQIRITRVSTSCSCTKAQVNRQTLSPHESTLVAVSFDPAVHKDDTDLGDVTRSIFVETDQINFPKVTAEIMAKVVKKQ